MKLEILWMPCHTIEWFIPRQALSFARVITQISCLFPTILFSTTVFFIQCCVSNMNNVSNFEAESVSDFWSAGWPLDSTAISEPLDQALLRNRMQNLMYHLSEPTIVYDSLNSSKYYQHACITCKCSLDADREFCVSRKPNSSRFHVEVDPSLIFCNQITKVTFLLWLQEIAKLPGTV
jgi:hypothetical protein